MDERDAIYEIRKAQREWAELRDREQRYAQLAAADICDDDGYFWGDAADEAEATQDTFYADFRGEEWL